MDFFQFNKVGRETILFSYFHIFTQLKNVTINNYLTILIRTKWQCTSYIDIGNKTVFEVNVKRNLSVINIFICL